MGAALVLWILLWTVDPEFLSGCQYSMRLVRLHNAHSSSFQGSTTVPEQLNIMAVTVACKLIDGCSLELCSSVVSSGICHRNKVNLVA